MPVEFEGDQRHRSILYAKLLSPAEEAPGMVKWLTNKGIAKSPEAATKLLLGIMVVSVAIIIYIVWNNSRVESTGLTKEQEAALLAPLQVDHLRERR
jgi:hypothetical protein